MKIVINNCYGGFGISKDAKNDLSEKIKSVWEIDRQDPSLIALLEEKGSKYCSAHYANLKVCEIPDEATDWRIEEYDGMETILYVIDGKIKSAY